MHNPRVSVVMATYNRSHHILPSIRSVLGQTVEDFELLVIGDAVTDDTGDHVRAIGDPRIHWHNLPTRARTQSGPNNHGIAVARGRIIAYLGQDDIWTPEHLERLLRCYAERPDFAAVASGLILHLPLAARPTRVFGIFEQIESFESRWFVPPSALSHRRDLQDLPDWRMRDEAEGPVDVDFQRRFLNNGLRIGGTGCATVHKWSSAGRYLSYLAMNSTAQEDMLARIQADGFDTYRDLCLATARRDGTFMTGGDPPETAKLNRMHDNVRGLDLSPPQPLTGPVTLEQDDGYRAMDWYPPQHDLPGFRWCGPTHSPRLLLPFCHDGLADITLDVRYLTARGEPSIDARLNGDPVRLSWAGNDPEGDLTSAMLKLTGTLKPNRHSVVEFSLPEQTFIPLENARRNGFAVGKIHLRPL